MKDFTEIVFVLDKSGSMEHITESTISSFNNFVKEQGEIGDNAAMSLYLFDGKVKKIYSDKPIRKVEPLTKETYKAVGNTAMNDAIGIAIDELGQKLAAMREEDRPNKQVIVILTDGQTNSDTIFNMNQISEKIKHQREKYNWQFLFLGANIDAIKTGGLYQIPTSACLNFSHNAVGSSNAMHANTRAISDWRTGVASGCAYTEDERLKAMSTK